MDIKLKAQQTRRAEKEKVKEVKMKGEIAQWAERANHASARQARRA